MENLKLELPVAKPKLIIDTNAFIKCLDLNKLSQTYEMYTSDMVHYEIKDKKGKEKFAQILFELKTKDPSKTSNAFVKNFAQKTGDFISLSETDLEIIAIAYTFAEESKKLDLLRKSPPDPQTYTPQSKNPEEKKITEDKSIWPQQKPKEEPKSQKEITKEDEKHKDNENLIKEDLLKEKTEINKIHEIEEKEINTEKNEKEEKEEKPMNITKKEETKVKEVDSDSDDDEGWINPDNFSQHFLTSQKVAEIDNNLGIAIMTSDFAMQNVILQIGIPLLSVDGLTIKQTRKWILECYSCYHLCKIMNREFCPNCGNHTMSKLSTSLNADGTYFIYRKANYHHKTRGLIYSIPKPKGGRNNDDLLLREDEFILKKKTYLGGDNKEKKREKTNFDKLQRDFENGLGFDVIKQEKYKNRKLEFGYGRSNPNEKKYGKKH